MDILIALLSIVVLVLVGSAGTIAAVHLTARSSAFHRIRRWVLLTHFSHKKQYPEPTPVANALGYLKVWASDLIHCPFCSSFWHTAWILLMIGTTVAAPMSWLVCAYLPVIGLCRIADDYYIAAHPTEPTKYTGTIRDLTK